MKCPKCGSDKFNPEYVDKGFSHAYLCYDCNDRESMMSMIQRQQSLITSLTAEIAETKAKAEKYRKGLEEAKVCYENHPSIYGLGYALNKIITKALEE